MQRIFAKSKPKMIVMASNKNLKLLPYMGNYVQFTNSIGLLNLDKTEWETAHRQDKKHDGIYFCVANAHEQAPCRAGYRTNKQ